MSKQMIEPTTLSYMPEKMARIGMQNSVPALTDRYVQPLPGMFNALPRVNHTVPDNIEAEDDDKLTSLGRRLASSTILNQTNAYGEAAAAATMDAIDQGKAGPVSARTRERAKTELDKRKDWAYTANHALFCLATDIPDIFGRWWLNNFQSGRRFSDAIVNPVSKYTGLSYLGKQKEHFFNQPAFDGFRGFLDKHLGKSIDEERTDRSIDKFFNKNKHTALAREFISELIGDSVAVPFTVGMQRAFPGFMNSLNKAGEKLQGGMYEKSSQYEAEKWGKEHGFEKDSEEVKAKQKELYAYEVGHLSQAYTWTVSSMFFNAASSKFFGNKTNYGRLVANNVISALTTFALVTLGRVQFPNKARKVDAWTKRTLVDPLFGKDKQTPRLEATGSEQLLPNVSPDKQKALLRMMGEHAQIFSGGTGHFGHDFVEQEKHILVAMEEALDIHSAFAEEFARQHYEAISQYYGHIETGDNNYGEDSLVNEDISRQSINSILLNRQNDLRTQHAMLDANEIIDTVKASMEAPGVRKVRLKNLELTPKKREELIGSLLQPNQFERGEPSVHIYATAKGQMLEHDALAKIFDPSGSLTKLLADEMKQRLPDIPPEHVEAIARNYMLDRHHAAKKTATACDLEGEVVKEAIARSKVLQRRFDIGKKEEATQPSIVA